VGNLKKRNDAINESKGEYIIFIDSDDYFTPNENSFQEIYDKIVIDKIDILEFKSFHFIPNDNSIIYQPRLFDLMYFSTDNFCSMKQFHLSGKLIKKSLLIEAFKNIDNYYFEKDMNYFEQHLILLILLKKANSFIFFNILQTAKLCNNNDINFYSFNQQNKRDFLLYLKFLIQKTDNNVPEKRLASSLFINYVVRRGIKFTEKEEIELLKENIKLLLNCIKINDNDHAIMEFYEKDYS
jgi:glycosyltransferase involved in cell wall biosynthesis